MNHKAEHLIDILHQHLQLEDLSDKGRNRDYVFHWQGIGNVRKKCLVVSISVPQLHMCLEQSLNIWRNLRLLN